MSVTVMGRVWAESSQKANRLLWLLAVADNANDDGWAYPATNTIAVKVRVNRRNAQKIADALEEAGEVIIYNRPNENDPTHHYTNVYHLAKYGNPNAKPPKDLRGGLHRRVVSPETLGSVARDTRVVSPETPEPSLEPLLENDVAVVFQKYFDVCGGTMSLTLSEIIRDAVGDFSAAWVIDALQLALENNVRKWSYAKKVLENWQRDGRESKTPPTDPHALPTPKPRDPRLLPDGTFDFSYVNSLEIEDWSR